MVLVTSKFLGPVGCLFWGFSGLYKLWGSHGLCELWGFGCQHCLWGGGASGVPGFGVTSNRAVYFCQSCGLAI